MLTHKPPPSPGITEPLRPAQTSYSTGTFRGTYEEGGKTFGIGGPAVVSKERPAAHAVTPLSTARPQGSTATYYVEQGKGTEVDNVGFIVRTNFNRHNEPVVQVYPYAIDPTKSGAFFDPKISTLVGRLVQMVREQGIEIAMGAQRLKVAAREIVGDICVQDYHGRKPVGWVKPGDNAASLKDLSFTLR
jgi:hypothetical protein